MNRAAKIGAVTQIGRLWDAILVTDDGLGARMCKKCAQSHRLGLGSGWGGGGIPLGGGGRRTENRDQKHNHHDDGIRSQKTIPIMVFGA